MQFSTERQMRTALIKVLRRRGIRPAVEIPFLGRSVDVAYRCANGSITAIELKLLSKDIKRALKQAKICLLAADRVYVCTRPHDVREEMKSTFRDLGVGLMFLKQTSKGASLTYVVRAAGNGRKREEYTAMLRRALKNR